MDDRHRCCSVTTNCANDIFLLPHVRIISRVYLHPHGHAPPPCISFVPVAHHPTSRRLSPQTPPDSNGVTQAITTPSPGEDPGATTHHSSESALTVSSPGATTAEEALRMVKDVDGMINRLPAARGSKGRTDGELSALEEEVKARGSCLTKPGRVRVLQSG